MMVYGIVHNLYLYMINTKLQLTREHSSGTLRYNSPILRGTTVELFAEIEQVLHAVI